MKFNAKIDTPGHSIGIFCITTSDMMATSTYMMLLVLGFMAAFGKNVVAFNPLKLHPVSQYPQQGPLR